MNKSIAAVVVTYNRKELLVNCLNSIFEQSHPFNAVFIIDNKSSDGTPEYLIKKKIIEQLPVLDSDRNENYSEVRVLQNGSKVTVNYIRKGKNDGGAGGFYEGMKLAYESGFDWIWFMDDDGIADKDQLQHLMEGNLKTNAEYLNALVVDIEDEDSLAFGLGKFNLVNEIKGNSIIEEEANPFNGTLIAKQVIEKVGFIKREMFIWGDESEYLKRVLKNNFNVVTVVSARHRHPKNKGKIENIIPWLNRPRVLVKPLNLAHIYYRNLTYLTVTYGSKYSLLRIFFYYFIYHLLRFQFKMVFLLIRYSFKGLRNDFD